MALLDLPKWISPHLYPGKNFEDFSEADLSDLRGRLSKFNCDDPEVSIMIPAWNEQDSIYRTLSSLASSDTPLKVELVVINNNSSDGTQNVLNALGVKSYFQPEQGISHARELGLQMAKGKYHLCADSDTYYPPKWIDLMTAPMRADNTIVGVYGRYSFMPPEGESKLLLKAYETVTGLLIRLRKYKREYINVLGFTMGFVTEIGRKNGGFEVKRVRKFDNSKDSEDFVDESEDGRMALNLKRTGKLKLITHPKARVYTSSRRLSAEGGLMKSFVSRLSLHSKRMFEYIAGKSSKDF